MRILLLTQWFTPEPTFKGLTFAKALKDRGHEVQVLTGFPNYPGGKLYPGYRLRPLQREVMEGIPVVRVPLYPSHDTSSVRRAANYLSFALSSAAIGPWAVAAADVAYVYHPPATVALPAMVLRRVRRIPFVYDVQDLWPDTLGATGMLVSRRLNALVGWWCRASYRAASKVVVLSPGFKKALVRRGVPEEKVEVVYNWCDEAMIRPGPRDEALARELGFAGRFNVLFSGTMGKAQALDAVLDAARLVSGRLPDVRFVFIGGGIEADRLRRKAEAERRSDVAFLPRRPVAEIGAILNLADVLLVHLRDDPLFEITIPSKTQAYLAMGRPILMAVRGDAADLVTRAGAAICCAPESPEGIATAVETLFRIPASRREEMGESGRKFYGRELAMSLAVSRFEEIFRSVAGRERNPERMISAS